MSRQINTRPDETLRQICTRQADRIEELEAEAEQWAKDFAEADKRIEALEAEGRRLRSVAEDMQSEAFAAANPANWQKGESQEEYLTYCRDTCRKLGEWDIDTAEGFSMRLYERAQSAEAMADRLAGALRSGKPRVKADAQAGNEALAAYDEWKEQK